MNENIDTLYDEYGKLVAIKRLLDNVVFKLYDFITEKESRIAYMIGEINIEKGYFIDRDTKMAVKIGKAIKMYLVTIDEIKEEYVIKN